MCGLSDRNSFKESCEPGNNPLMQLNKDERIKDHFYMHHSAKREWLLNNWANAYTKRQPVDDIREYFGEGIALYFSWMGFLLTMLWVPALTGVCVFAIGLAAFATGGTFDNPYVPLFCVLVSVWSIVVDSNWQNLETAWQYQWGTLDYEEPQADRAEFVQSKRTHKLLKELLEKEEYYPDPLWHGIALALTWVSQPLLVGCTIALYVAVDIFEAFIAPSTGGKLGPAAYLGAAPRVCAHCSQRECSVPGILVPALVNLRC
jgi:hypothetical protein